MWQIKLFIYNYCKCRGNFVTMLCNKFRNFVTNEILC